MWDVGSSTQFGWTLFERKCRVKLCIQRSQSMTYFSSRAVFLSAGKVLDEVSSFPDYIYNIACLS